MFWVYPFKIVVIMLKFGNKHWWTKILLFHTITERVRVGGTSGSYLVQFLALSMAAFKVRALLSWVLKISEDVDFCCIFRYLILVLNHFCCEKSFPCMELEFCLLLIFLFQKCATTCFNTSERFAGFFQNNKKIYLLIISSKFLM